MAKLSLTDPTGLGDKEQGYLTLTTVKDGDRRLGGETQTTSLPGYGFGYYETRMIVDPEHAVGACLSYFWKEGGHKDGHRLYGEGEIDIEFLANEDWATHPEKNGKVHFSLHPSHQSHTVDLPFNPSTGYHRYGFIWTADKVVFTADGVAIHTMVDPYLSHVPPEGGWIMANVWSGAWVWGGGPPETPLSAVYNRMVFYPGATEIEDLKPLAP
jgi:beta-glucanase (GH16 family)